MITRTERYYGSYGSYEVRQIAMMEDAGWAVRQIVFEPTDPDYSTAMIVVYEREIG